MGWNGAIVNDLKQWLEANRQTLEKRNVREIAQLAITCGFDGIIVAQWLVSQLFKKENA